MAILSTDTLTGKQAEQATIELALSKINQKQVDWQTVVVGTSQEINVPRERLWATFAQLEGWPAWSGLVRSARWTKTGAWESGAQFEQTLDLGPLGVSVSPETIGAVVPGQSVMWWKDANGISSSHVWTFETLADGRTRITNIEVFHGGLMGLVKPLVFKDWQNKFEASVTGLVAQAARGQ